MAGPDTARIKSIRHFPLLLGGRYKQWCTAKACQGQSSSPFLQTGAICSLESGLLAEFQCFFFLAKQLLLPSGGELDERSWQQYVDKLRSRKEGPLKREDMLLW
jgi:hypothetical protein